MFRNIEVGRRIKMAERSRWVIFAINVVIYGILYSSKDWWKLAIIQSIAGVIIWLAIVKALGLNNKIVEDYRKNRGA